MNRDQFTIGVSTPDLKTLKTAVLERVLQHIFDGLGVTRTVHVTVGNEVQSTQITIGPSLDKEKSPDMEKLPDDVSLVRFKVLWHKEHEPLEARYEEDCVLVHSTFPLIVSTLEEHIKRAYFPKIVDRVIFSWEKELRHPSPHGPGLPEIPEGMEDVIREEDRVAARVKVDEILKHPWPETVAKEVPVVRPCPVCGEPFTTEHAAGYCSPKVK